MHFKRQAVLLTQIGPELHFHDRIASNRKEDGGGVRSQTNRHRALYCLLWCKEPTPRGRGVFAPPKKFFLRVLPPS